MAMLVQRSNTRTLLDQIRAQGELRVVTLNLPTCYYIGPQGPTGLEYDLARKFADELGVRLKIFTVPNQAALQAALASGRADIAAAQISADAAWRQVGQPATAYAQIPQLVIYRQGEPAPTGVPQLHYAKLEVRAGSPQAHVLQKLKLVAPFLQWEDTPSKDSPLQDVASGQAGYAVVDARAYGYEHYLYPNVRVAFALPQRRPVQWIVRRDAPELLRVVDNFFASLRRSGQLHALMRKDSGNATSIHIRQPQLFEVDFIQRLPRYETWFEEAAARYHLDWRLLAAMGFQESRWNPGAISAAGAKGVMMLTADTAQQMGVTNRANARASIFAGAHYFAQVLKMWPDHIPEPDRIWFAVASYNVGFGHVEDARVLAQRLGKNPDSWKQVSRVLPLLTEPRWYLQSEYGYCQGWQPVMYVARVQEFLHLLEWQPASQGIIETADTKPVGQPRAVSGS
jgi:membrane-bound lytic murein transglycosylase F